MTRLTFDTYKVEADYAPKGSRRRSGLAMVPGVQFVVAHDTGNPTATARAHARHYQNDPNPAKVASAHIFVDDVDIIETIPALTGDPEQALHVRNDRPFDNDLYGFDANRAAIGVELCFGGGIDPDAAYERYVWTIAKICHEHILDPTRHVVGHQFLDPARRDDPGSALALSGRSYQQLLRDIVSVYRECCGGDGTIGTGRLQPGDAETTVNLAIRSAPRRMGTKPPVMRPGTRVNVLEIVDGELVELNDDWARIGDDQYCWSGGLRNI
jgi:hypothetical protein